MYTRISTIEKMDALIDFIAKDIKEKVDIAIIGLSGGADSTLVASICTLALGAENVYGISMPYGQTDLTKFNSNSNKLAMKLGVNHISQSITTPVDAFIGNFGAVSTLNEGNLRSRMRMLNLYAYCCRVSEQNAGKRVRVMGTGNRSEDFIGYDTKGGDALADLFPIGELYKKEVYALLDRLAERGIIDASTIDRVPSAGLWEGQTDEGELGCTYNDMAPAVEFCVTHMSDMENSYEFALNHYRTMHAIDDADAEVKMIEFVWKRHIINRHKHMAPYVTNLSKV